VVELELLEGAESAVTPFEEPQALLVGRAQMGKPVVVSLGLVKERARDERDRGESQ
jgi:hypothetical protein